MRQLSRRNFTHSPSTNNATPFNRPAICIPSDHASLQTQTIRCEKDRLVCVCLCANTLEIRTPPHTGITIMLQRGAACSMRSHSLDWFLRRGVLAMRLLARVCVRACSRIVVDRIESIRRVRTSTCTHSRRRPERVSIGETPKWARVLPLLDPKNHRQMRIGSVASIFMIIDLCRTRACQHRSAGNFD